MSAVPPPYTRATSFTSSEIGGQLIPSASLLDTEFNRVATSLNDTQDRLGEIQRDDGQLENGIVTADSLSSSVLASLEAGAQGAMTTTQIAMLTLANQNALNAAVTSAGIYATQSQSYATQSAAFYTSAQALSITNSTQLAVVNATAQLALITANAVSQQVGTLSTTTILLLTGGTMAGPIYGATTSTNPLTTKELVNKAFVQAAALGSLTTSDFPGSLATQGYQQFTGGLILQWGVSNTITSGSELTVTFPTPFPTECFTVTATGIQASSSSGSQTIYWDRTASTASQFVLGNDSNGSSDDIRAAWTALGR